jgi:hypothetical protein
MDKEARGQTGMIPSTYNINLMLRDNVFGEEG